MSPFGLELWKLVFFFFEKIRFWILDVCWNCCWRLEMGSLVSIMGYGNSRCVECLGYDKWEQAGGGFW